MIRENLFTIEQIKRCFTLNYNNDTHHNNKNNNKFLKKFFCFVKFNFLNLKKIKKKIKFGIDASKTTTTTSTRDTSIKDSNLQQEQKSVLITSDKFEMSETSSNSGEVKTFFLSASSILVYYLFSISITFYNRHLFLTMKYPLSITIIHLIFKFLAAALIRALLNFTLRFKRFHLTNARRVTLDWSTFIKSIIPFGVASAVDIGCSNWSLQYITVTLYTMSKSTVILFILFFSLLFKLEKWRHSLILVVLCIAVGLFLFTYHSTQFHLFGFIVVIIASFCSGLRWTLAQTITQKHQLGLSNPIDMIYHIQPGMILCLLPLAIYVEGVSIVSTEKFFRSDNFQTVMYNSYWILIGAVLGFFLETSELLVVTFTSSLTLSVSGIFKEICIIYLAVIWNHNKLNTMNTIGLIVCLLGITIHVIVKAKSNHSEIAQENTRKTTRNRMISINTTFEYDSDKSDDLNSRKQMRRANSSDASTQSSSTKLAKTSIFTKSKSFSAHPESIKMQQQEPLLRN